MRSAESELRQPEPIVATGGSVGPVGDAPRLVLLAGAPRSGKRSAARRLVERLGYETVCIDDLVVAVRAVTMVASHPEDSRDDRNRLPRASGSELTEIAALPRRPGAFEIASLVL